jgi:hypothetical protein
MLASIKATKIDKEIIEHELEVLFGHSKEEPGQFLMLILNILEWFKIFTLSQTENTHAALTQPHSWIEIIYAADSDCAQLMICTNPMNALTASPYSSPHWIPLLDHS